MKKRIVLKKKSKLIIILLLIILFIGNLVPIIKWCSDNYKIKKGNMELLKIVNIYPLTEKEKLDQQEELDFTKLREINNDTVGWLSISGTNINYPVVQTNNNDYYLKRDFYKRINSAGTIFMDYRNNSNDFDKNTILYGHNRLDNSMFGSLKEITKKKWREDDSQKFIFYGNGLISYWEVFSAYIIKEEEYYITTNFSKINYSEFLNVLKKRSSHQFKTEITEQDKIITLSTCEGSEGNKRFVIHAKLKDVE